MTVEEIKELIQVVNESGIAELEVQRGENRVRIRRATAPASQEFVLPHGSVMAPLSQVSPQTHATAVMAQAHPAAGPNQAAPVSEGERVYVKSPIVGTFYRSAEPDAKPFADVGQTVKRGEVLCIIEAMKLMNEINAECDGEVVKVYVENGQAVHYGERLFAIKPHV